MRMFYVAAKAKFLEQSSLCLDDLVFESNIIRVKNDRSDCPATPNLSDVPEDVYDITYLSRGLLYFRGQGYACHRSRFHGVAHQGLGVVHPLKQHLSAGHGNLA